VCGVVRKIRGTLRQHVGCNAHEDCVLCSCTPEMYKPPQQAFSPHISRGYTAQQNSQPVNRKTIHRLRALGLGCMQRRARDGQSRYHHTDEALAPRDAVATSTPSSGPGGSLHAITHTASGMGICWKSSRSPTVTRVPLNSRSWRTMPEAPSAVMCSSIRISVPPSARSLPPWLVARNPQGVGVRQWHALRGQTPRGLLHKLDDAVAP